MAQRVPPRSDDLHRQLLSIVDAASSLGISRAGVYRLVGEGALPVVKIGKRSLIDSRDISTLIERRKAVR
jgi:excisionase family DNA binding protein